MLNLNSIIIFSEDPKALAGFYENVLGKGPNWVDNGYYGFECGSTYLTIGPHDKVKGKSHESNRIMINLETDNVEKEFKRIKEEADPKVIAEPYEMGGDGFFIATFEDPDGNTFQLMSPFDVDLSKN